VVGKIDEDGTIYKKKSLYSGYDVLGKVSKKK
jgi:hypothetical protein